VAAARGGDFSGLGGRGARDRTVSANRQGQAIGVVLSCSLSSDADKRLPGWSLSGSICYHQHQRLYSNENNRQPYYQRRHHLKTNKRERAWRAFSAGLRA